MPVRPTAGDDVTRAHPVPPTIGPVGTLGYMAPEVLRGEPASAASDIWSMGVLLFEAASGNQPFGGLTQADVVNAITKESPAPLPAKISAGLRGVIQRCLMKEPAQRYRHAAAVEAALEAIQSTASVAPQPRDGRRALVIFHVDGDSRVRAGDRRRGRVDTSSRAASAIDKEKRAGGTFACLHLREILPTDQVSHGGRNWEQQGVGRAPAPLEAPREL